MFILTTGWMLALTTGGHALTCANGALTPREEWCKFFIHYVPRGQRTVDPRISSRFPAAQAGDPEIRSFALVINISKYPNLVDPKRSDLVGVRNDLPNIVSFLKEQQFDEIIVVSEDAATPDTIRDLFDLYIIPQVKVFAERSRFLFAYDGHGARGDDATLPGGLALSGTTGDGDNDPRNVYPLDDLRNRLTRVANFAYQAVALLGSCYSGGVFPPNPHGGQNYSYSLKRGAHVVTAARADRLAIVYPDGRGTVFFEALIRAIREAKPRSTEYTSIIDTASETVVSNAAIVRLARAVDDVNEELETKPYPQLTVGEMAPNKDFEGAFFFLGSAPATVASIAGTETKGNSNYSKSIARTASELIQSRIVTATSVEGSTGSSVKSRPNISIFAFPEAYKIRGIDLGHVNRQVDFDQLRKNDVRFVYLKATQGAHFVDRSFASRLKSAAKANIPAGVYHVFSFCQSVPEQIANLTKNVPRDPDSLPIAIDIEWFGEPAIRHEEACNSIPEIRNKVRALAVQIENYSGKKPIIYAPSRALTEIIDKSFSEYPIWISDWSARARIGGLPSKSENPWTIWQFTDQAEIPGVAGKVDLNAFFGTEEQFRAFKLGKDNVALSATR